MKIFSPISFRNLNLVNRWVMSPMCMYSAKDGLANDFHLVHYGSRAQGGVGLVIVEATAVVPEGRITKKCLGLWNSDQQKAFAKITDFVHSQSNAKVGIQLSHAGRKASTKNGVQIDNEDGGWDTVSPSGLPYQPEDKTPQTLDINGIQKIVLDFKKSAQKAVEAGFDVVEIHAAHGYLIQQFLSPLSNIRTDAYGGSFENRCRFLLEIIDAVNDVLNDEVALFVRISATEYGDGGWDLNDSIKLSELMKDRNVDLVDVSSGGSVFGAKITVFNAYQVPFSAEIKAKVDVKVGAVGMINTLSQAEDILQNSKADLIFMGRELLINPTLPIRSAIDNNQNYYLQPQYIKAKK